MPKVREKSEVEYLRSENKRLKSENRHLKKQVNLKKKREHLHKDLEEREAEVLLEERLQEEAELAVKQSCPKCQGDVDIIEGEKISIVICQSCKYRFSKRNG